MLEQVIAENTAAIRELIALLKSGKATAPAAEAEAPKAEPVNAEAPKAEPVKTEGPKAEPVKEQAPKAAPAPVAEITANEVKAKFMAATREAKLAALKAVGVARFSEVKPEQFAAFAAALEA
jgi:hypothetical protein